MINHILTVLECQNPSNPSFINRNHSVIQCSISKGTEAYNEYLNEAIKLASMVNPNAANDSEAARNSSRIMQDAFGGVLAEKGWLSYLNQTLGAVASPTPFVSANGQIDIILTKGERIEVRSSFPRNGVKFATCIRDYNFKIIGAYKNLYKPDEVQKDFYTSVLFETSKSNILTDNTVYFYLIGCATADMMRGANSFTNSLVAEGDLTEVRTNYRLIQIKNSWDINEFITHLRAIGY